MEFIFLYVDKHQRFYKLASSLLMKVARDLQSKQNTFIVIQNIQMFCERQKFLPHC